MRNRVRRPGNGPTSPAAKILCIDSLTIAYGPIRALDAVSIDVRESELVAVVGPNGAGKSSLMAALTGFVRPRGGEIRYRDKRLDGHSPEKRVAAGIALVPEGRRVFPALTVEENLKAAYRRRRNDIADAIERHLSYFPQLKERWKSPAGKLSGGEQQQLAIARALLSEPSLLLLDEPSLGLAPTVIDQVYEILEQLNDAGLSILLVEQNANRVLDISDRVYILRNGRVELSGPTADVASDERFGQAYFGF